MENEPVKLQSPESRPNPDRRRWLIGAALALIILIALIVFMAARGGRNHGNMPGMDMNGMSLLPQRVVF